MTNKNCKFFDSQYCELLNMQACKGCAFGDIKFEEEAQGIRDDLELLTNLVPEEGVAPLFTSPTCQFCVETPRKTTCYAFTDIGHPEPERVKRNFLGIKTRARVGSMIPIQIACCDRCRWNYRLMNLLPTVLSLVFPVAALVLLSIGPVQRGLTAANQWLPVLLFLGAVLLGLFVSMLSRILIRRSMEKVTVFNAWELPLMQKLKKLGWFSLTEDKRGARLVFSKKRLIRGVFTGETARGRAK